MLLSFSRISGFHGFPGESYASCRSNWRHARLSWHFWASSSSRGPAADGGRHGHDREDARSTRWRHGPVRRACRCDLDGLDDSQDLRGPRGAHWRYHLARRDHYHGLAHGDDRGLTGSRMERSCSFSRCCWTTARLPSTSAAKGLCWNSVMEAVTISALAMRSHHWHNRGSLEISLGKIQILFRRVPVGEH